LLALAELPGDTTIQLVGREDVIRAELAKAGGVLAGAEARIDGLAAGVVAALRAHAVRAPGRAALRARLEGDGRRLLVRVTGALLTL